MYNMYYYIYTYITPMFMLEFPMCSHVRKMRVDWARSSHFTGPIPCEQGN